MLYVHCPRPALFTLHYLLCYTYIVPGQLYSHCTTCYAIRTLSQASSIHIALYTYIVPGQLYLHCTTCYAIRTLSQASSIYIALLAMLYVHCPRPALFTLHYLLCYTYIVPGQLYSHCTTCYAIHTLSQASSIHIALLAMLYVHCPRPALFTLHYLHLCDHSPKQRPRYEANEGQDSFDGCLTALALFLGLHNNGYLQYKIIIEITQATNTAVAWE